MEFKGIQKTLSYEQINEGNPSEVFPLLCPVRETEWLDGWKYQMIHSKSGIIEKDCVFSTPQHGEADTIWQTTQYDPENYLIEFLRITPQESVTKINIQLEPQGDKQTKALIQYQYTGLNEAQNQFIQEGLAQSFQESMQWWEKAINHYLKTGELLKKA